MAITLALDVYGTMINTSGVIATLEGLVGNQAGALSHLWREKQLEYSFRRALMQNYADFSVCTLQALEYACRFLGVELSAEDKRRLLETYRVLPPHPEVKEGISRLKAAGYCLFAFSNGRAADVQHVLRNAGIDTGLDGIVSTDDLRSFKPNPAVYAHFLRQSGARGSDAWLVSGNPFDIIGAISFGMRAAWVKRSPQAVFDPWEIEPTITVSGITELKEALEG